MRIRASEKFSIWRGRMFTLSWFLALVLMTILARTKDEFPSFASHIPIPPVTFALYFGFLLLCGLQIAWAVFKLWADRRRRPPNAILISDPLPQNNGMSVWEQAKRGFIAGYESRRS